MEDEESEVERGSLAGKRAEVDGADFRNYIHFVVNTFFLLIQISVYALVKTVGTGGGGSSPSTTPILGITGAG